VKITQNATGKNRPRNALEVKRHKTSALNDNKMAASEMESSPRQSAHQCSGVSKPLMTARKQAKRLTEKPATENPNKSETTSRKPLQPERQMYAIAQTKRPTYASSIKSGNVISSISVA
jgi:hypothetical protein